jgi:hypothetical protein
VNNVTRLAATLAAFLITAQAAPPAGLHPLSGPAAAYAEEDWQKEFDEVCSKTEGAMALSAEELKALVDKCDKLKPKIAGLDETRSKVYMKRLQRTRDYYIFVLESKEKK